MRGRTSVACGPCRQNPEREKVHVLYDGTTGTRIFEYKIYGGEVQSCVLYDFELASHGPSVFCNSTASVRGIDSKIPTVYQDKIPTGIVKELYQPGGEVHYKSESAERLLFLIKKKVED